MLRHFEKYSLEKKVAEQIKKEFDKKHGLLGIVLSEGILLDGGGGESVAQVFVKSLMMVVKGVHIADIVPW
ncbi:hypothetical protein ACHQM5_026817 [Ranunculus cassubicifolius]